MKVALFVIAPILEIIAAAFVAHFIGWGPTVLLLAVASLIGMWQIKVQGLAAWRSARREIIDGAAPAPSVLDGALRLIGAVLLTLPGFLSAIVGSALLARPARRIVAKGAGIWVIGRFGIPFVVVSDDTTSGWRFRSTSEPDYVDVDGWEDPNPSAAGDRRSAPPKLTTSSDRPGGFR